MSAQLDLVLPDRAPPLAPEWPTEGSQCETLLKAMGRGEKLRPLEAAHKYGVMALSQRMTDLRKLRWPVITTLVSVPSGARIAEYTLPAQFIHMEN